MDVLLVVDCAVCPLMARFITCWRSEVRGFTRFPMKATRSFDLRPSHLKLRENCLIRLPIHWLARFELVELIVRIFKCRLSSAAPVACRAMTGNAPVSPIIWTWMKQRLSKWLLVCYRLNFDKFCPKSADYQSVRRLPTFIRYYRKQRNTSNDLPPCYIFKSKLVGAIFEVLETFRSVHLSVAPMFHVIL